MQNLKEQQGHSCRQPITHLLRFYLPRLKKLLVRFFSFLFIQDLSHFEQCLISDYAVTFFFLFTFRVSCFTQVISSALMNLLQIYLTRTLFFQEITPFGTHPKTAFVNVQITIRPQLLQNLWLMFDCCDAERQLLLLQSDKWRKSVRWMGGQKWDFSCRLLPVSNKQPYGWLFSDSKQVQLLN